MYIHTHTHTCRGCSVHCIFLLTLSWKVTALKHHGLELVSITSPSPLLSRFIARLHFQYLLTVRCDLTRVSSNQCMGVVGMCAPSICLVHKNIHAWFFPHFLSATWMLMTKVTRKARCWEQQSLYQAGCLKECKEQSPPSLLPWPWPVHSHWAIMWERNKFHYVKTLKF